MKAVFTLPLFLIPLLLLWTGGQSLQNLFDDRRPIHNAKRLEDIHGRVAGQRVNVTPSGAAKSYQIRSGDTWWSIAKTHGIEDVDALADHNGNPTLLPGVTIEIPLHMVKK